MDEGKETNSMEWGSLLYEGFRKLGDWLRSGLAPETQLTNQLPLIQPRAHTDRLGTCDLHMNSQGRIHQT